MRHAAGRICCLKVYDTGNIYIYIYISVQLAGVCSAAVKRKLRSIAPGAESECVDVQFLTLSINVLQKAVSTPCWIHSLEIAIGFNNVSDTVFCTAVFYSSCGKTVTLALRTVGWQSSRLVTMQRQKNRQSGAENDLEMSVSTVVECAVKSHSLCCRLGVGPARVIAAWP